MKKGEIRERGQHKRRGNRGSKNSENSIEGWMEGRGKKGWDEIEGVYTGSMMRG